MRVRIYSNGNPINGTKILNLDTGQEVEDVKKVSIFGDHLYFKAMLWFHYDSGRQPVKIEAGDVELGNWDEYMVRGSGIPGAVKAGRKLRNLQVAGVAEVKDPVDPNCIIIDNRHPDAKLPCPECGDKGYVDLATSREPCNLCRNEKTTRINAADFAKGGVISGTTVFAKSAALILYPTKLENRPDGTEVRVSDSWKPIKVKMDGADLAYPDPRKKIGVLGDPYFTNESEARGAAMQELCSREELRGINRSEIFEVVEEWIDDELMLCDDAEEFWAFCCDMSGEILANVEALESAKELLRKMDGAEPREIYMGEGAVEALVSRVNDRRLIANTKITKDNIGGYCKLCARPLPYDGIQCCDPCIVKREQQVMDLARDQIKKKLVKAGDTCGITFDPDNMVIKAAIKEDPRGSFYAVLLREKEPSIEYTEEKSPGVTPEPCDECNGSGFYEGLNSTEPCSKGCKPKK